MNEEKKDLLAGLLKHPWIIIIIFGIITVFFGFQLPKTELDNNNIRFIPDDDEARMTSRYIDETFGSSFFVLVALERKYGDVFDAAFINRIREFNDRIEEIEIVNSINSIVSSDYIFSEIDPENSPGGQSSIVVRKLVGEDFSGTTEEITELKRRLLSWDIYRNSLISDDFSSTQILVTLSITQEIAGRPEMIDRFIEIRDVAKDMFSGFAEVYVTGLPIISTTITEAMRFDLKTMIPLVALVVLIVLFFSFRRFTFVILPLVTVLVAAVWSMGAIPLFGLKLSVVSTVLPVILVAVGSAYGIHVVTHYLGDLNNIPDTNAEITEEEHRALIIKLLRRIGKSVSLAALTTLAGFSSFCFTRVAPIREFGIFSTFGVLVSFIAALTLIPSLLIIRGPRPIKKTGIGQITKDGRAGPDFDHAIASFFLDISKRKGTVIFYVVLILIVSFWGVSKVTIDNIFVEYFKSTTDISRSDLFIREKFGGSKTVSVVARADSAEALLMPDVLSAMDSLGSYLEEDVPEAGKVLGFTDLVKRINQVLNADESPEGIRPGTQSVSSFYDEGSFGFSDINGFDDFGFSDFGFDAFDENDSRDTSDPDSGIFKIDEPVNNREAISANEFVALLQKAASSGKSRSMDVPGLVREMEKLVNFEGASYYEIPNSPAKYGKTTPIELQQLVANYLILLSGSIDSYANDSLAPTAIKSTVQLRTLGNTDTMRVIDQIREFISDHFPPGIEIVIGGPALIEDSLNRLVVQSQVISVIISVIIVFLIVTLSYRSLIAGIIGIAPLSICIVINFAVMGFTGIKLNIGTSMVASVSVGIGIDYTIHFIESYRREYLASGGKGDFLLKAYASSGKAIIINAVSVGAGFAVLLFSQFIMLKDLGLLIALTMGGSAIVSLTVIPVLLSALKPKFIWKELS